MVHHWTLSHLVVVLVCNVVESEALDVTLGSTNSHHLLVGNIDSTTSPLVIVERSNPDDHPDVVLHREVDCKEFI